MKKLIILTLLINSFMGVHSQVTEITLSETDNFSYDEDVLHHYGVGFHQFADGGGNWYNLYCSGYGGVNFFTNGQNRLRIQNGGNVGIGTDSPAEKLTLFGGNMLFKSSDNDAGDIIFRNSSNSQLGRIWSNNAGSTGLYFSSGDNTADLSIDNGGNIGIGKTDPESKLDVNGTINANNLLVNANSNYASLELISNLGSFIDFHSSTSSDYNGRIIWNYNNSSRFDIYGNVNFRNDVAASNLTVGSSIVCSGGIVLGGFAPNSDYYANNNYISFGHAGVSEDFIGYKNNTFYFKDSPGGGDESDPNIRVGGNIISEKTIYAEEIQVKDIAATNLKLEGDLAADKIIVRANGNTADFVFDANYNLKDLSEVDKYVKTHKHLPGIPSADEMDKEGVDLAEMNKLLLQKVEELTLYLVQKDKQISYLEQEKVKRERLQKDLDSMQSEIEDLKKIILNKKTKFK